MIENISKDTRGVDGLDNFFNNNNIKREIFDETKCKIAMLYLMDIENEEHSYNITKESGFLYLNYWLHNNVKEHYTRSETKKIYEALLKDHKTIYDDSSCLDYLDYNISNHDINGIDKMISMYVCLNKNKHQGHSSPIDPLCNAVKTFVNKYNAEIHSETGKSEDSKLSHQCINNTRAPTIILTVVTPFGSHLRDLLIRKRNNYNTIDTETNNIKSAELYRDASNYKKYDIYYHCD
ncbi:variable surface protein [Plasmodium gonderi]|uniref:Variable surface protein n=1 Tax=Plasmodium gonderi TaxID=77519 RepID=A0A1Y1JN73_PLAGO|nr:variable surface protein [Plasmodium gonderi]GAW83921.1 variable surface protein [Plasmodium gonderi]